jgi:hypothetical protein
MSTALVPVSVRHEETFAPRGCARVRADFLAQLIGIALQAPQTRLRRRAEPQEAMAVYQASGCAPKATGQMLSRSL